MLIFLDTSHPIKYSSSKLPVLKTTVSKYSHQFHCKYFIVCMCVSGILTFFFYESKVALYNPCKIYMEMRQF